MGHDVVNARNHLIAGHRHGKLRIEHGEFGKNIFSENVTYFKLFLAVGDDRAAVHLAARARHGQNASDRHYGIVNVLESVEIFVPRVLVAENRYGHRFGIVAHRAAAHRKQQVGFCRARLLYSVPEFFRRGIGHNAAVLENFLAVAFENVNHFVVNSVFLDGTAAVNEHNVFAVTRKLLVQSVESIFPEIQFGGIAVSKVSKHIFSLLLTFFI